MANVPRASGKPLSHTNARWAFLASVPSRTAQGRVRGVLAAAWERKALDCLIGGRKGRGLGLASQTSTTFLRRARRLRQSAAVVFG